MCDSEARVASMKRVVVVAWHAAGRPEDGTMLYAGQKYTHCSRCTWSVLRTSECELVLFRVEESQTYSVMRYPFLDQVSRESPDLTEYRNV